MPINASICDGVFTPAPPTTPLEFLTFFFTASTRLHIERLVEPYVVAPNCDKLVTQRDWVHSPPVCSDDSLIKEESL